MRGTCQAACSFIRRLTDRGLGVFFGWLYYDLAWAYDAFSGFVSVGQWRAWQRAALPFVGGRRVLEIAHGTGDLLLNLVERDFEPIGLELSPAMGAITRQKLRGREHGLTAPLVRGSARVLPFASAVLPAVLATFPPTDLVRDQAVLAELRRVLVFGGTLVLVPTAHITGRGVRDRLAAWIFEIMGQSAPWPQAASELLATAGFRVWVQQVWLPRSRVTVVIAEKSHGLAAPAGTH